MRSPPEIPERVAYFTLKELCAAVAKHSPPWVVLKSAEDFLAVGLIDEESDVAVKVTFLGNFVPNVTRHGLFIQVFINNNNTIVILTTK